MREWLGSILERLHRQAGGSASTPGFRVLSWGAVNAFVTPEGVVYVTTALLSQVSSDDELACILAHEMAHFRLGHHQGQEKLGKLWKALGMLAMAAPGGVVSAQALGLLAGLRHSRGHELEADRAALEVCVGAGYSPAGLLQFLGRQHAEEGALNDTVSGWFSTHPSNPERIRQVRDFLTAHGIDPDRRPTVGLSFQNRGIFLKVDPRLGPGGGDLPREEARRPIWSLGERATLKARAREPVTLRSPRISIDMPGPMEVSASYRITGNGVVAAVIACFDGPGRYLDQHVLESSHGGPGPGELRLELGGARPIPRGTRHVEIELALTGERTTRLLVERLQLLPVLEAPMFGAPGAPSLASSAVPNGGFEEGARPDGTPLSWSVERGRAVLDGSMNHSGRRSVRCHAESAKHTVVLVSDRFALDPGMDHLVSGYLRSCNGKQRMSLGVRFYDATGTPLSTAFVAAEGIFPPDRFTKYHGILSALGGKYPIPPEAREIAVVGEAGYYSTDPCWFDDIAVVPVQSGPAGSAPVSSGRPGSREELEKMKQDF